jgi:hypothetical protein
MTAGSAAIWSGALQASATLLAAGADGPRWPIDQPEREYLGVSPGPRSGTARRVVELAVQIIMELPDDPHVGVQEAKYLAQQWLETRER